MSKWKVYQRLLGQFEIQREIVLRNRSLHIILMVLSAFLLINFRQGWEIKTHLIGLVSLLTLLNFLNIPQENLRTRLKKLDRGQMLMIALSIILLINVRYLSWLSLSAWLSYLGPLDFSFNDAMFLCKKTEKKRQTVGFYILVHFAFIFWMINLMKYQQFIEIDWKYTIAPVAILWFVAWIFIIAGYILKGALFQIFHGINAAFCGSDTITSQEQTKRQENANFLKTACLYFLWFLLFADIYLPTQVYSIIINIITTLNTIIAFGYLFFFKYVHKYFMKDFFDRHAVHQQGDKFIFGITKIQSKFINKNLPFCMFCSKNVDILHRKCGKSLMCQICNQKSGKSMKLGEVYCPTCEPDIKTGNFYYIFDKEQVVKRQLDVKIFNYLQDGCFLVGMKFISESNGSKCCIY